MEISVRLSLSDTVRVGGASAIIAAAISAAVCGAEPPRNHGKDWPTLHGDVRRPGFYPNFPVAPLKLIWRKELHEELTGPRAETIVGNNLAFMGTYRGNMYAWDAATGKRAWVFHTNGAIGHSPMFHAGVLYFGSMDGRLYAVRASDGKKLWSFEAEEGIWVAPLVFQGRVLFGARDGVFYALDAADGTRVWSHDTGAPILTTASIADDADHVLFASEDMHAYCLHIESGRLRWKSRKMHGLSVRDYFPVIVGGLAIYTTNPVRGFHETLTKPERMLLDRAASAVEDDRYIPATPESVAAEQQFIIDYLERNPEQQTFYAFRVTDGTEPWTAPILYTGGLHNPHTPPCYNPHTLETYVLLRTAYGVWDGGSEVRSYTGLGKLDLDTGRVQLVEHSYKPTEGRTAAGRKDMPWGQFNLIGDETQALSVSPRFLFSNHQGYLGTLSFETGQCQNLWGRRDTYGGFYGPAAFGWGEAGRQQAREAGQPYGIVNEWHGPARAIVSVAGKYVYYSVGSQVLCLKGS